MGLHRRARRDRRRAAPRDRGLEQRLPRARGVPAAVVVLVRGQDRGDHDRQQPVLQRYVTFWPNFHHFDRFELDLRGHMHVWGAAFSCLRIKLADMVLI